jgi:hypothetical protein
MIGDVADEFWVGDVWDHPKLPAAERADGDVYLEYSLQALCSGRRRGGLIIAFVA